MATVFMKWLETSPRGYERGIQILTLGRLGRLRQRLTQENIRPGMRVLEIGCGTGRLSVQMAGAGARVTAIDASAAMLAEAQRSVAEAGCQAQVELRFMDASQIGDVFAPGSFDLIVASLVFSELSLAEQRFVLSACKPLLAEGGRVLLADEMTPQILGARIVVRLVRLPLGLITWLLTRTTTHPLEAAASLSSQAGFDLEKKADYLGGSLMLFELCPTEEPAWGLPAGALGQLRHQVTLRSLMIDLWAVFFRLFPPYPKVRPGLYAVGQPGPDSPVLVTGNFDLTVRRLVKAIDGKVNVWLLAANSSGINVWCAAGGGFLTAERVIGAVKAAHLHEVVHHHALILPQLCANGVDGWRIRRETGWGVHWGPVRAADIPDYLAGHRHKSDPMRWVRFPIRDRLEMMTVMLGFYGFMLLIAVAIFWRHLFWPATITMLGLSYFYAIALPWLPGRDGLFKSIPLAAIALAGLLAYRSLLNPMPWLQFFHWVVGLTGFSVFTAAEMQGMSPRMRGEQANWSWEAVIAAALGLIYWLAPRLLGWR
jgi:ubiquinone/menaquinone biosynthesis C-methylase UbiE